MGVGLRNSIKLNYLAVVSKETGHSPLICETIDNRGGRGIGNARVFIGESVTRSRDHRHGKRASEGGYIFYSYCRFYIFRAIRKKPETTETSSRS